MRIYADTSFLVSLYSPDINSAAAALTMRTSKGDHLISTFAELELVNALQLRVFRRELSSAQVNSALRSLENDLQGRLFQLLPLPDQAFDRARQLAIRTTAVMGSRSADLLHVAAALELNANCIYSFDQQQRKLAQHLHLKVN